MNKDKLSLKLRPFSPIKKSEFVQLKNKIPTLKHKAMPTNGSSNLKSTKSTKPSTLHNITITDPYDTLPDENGKKSTVPKNINEYKHLMSENNLLGYGELKWTLGLRTNPNYYNDKNKKRKPQQTTVLFHPPSFYDEDLSKFKAKNKIRPFSSTINNFSKISHLTKTHNGESVNGAQFNFETTLRNFKPRNGDFYNKNEWNDVPYTSRITDEVKFPPPFTQYSLETMKKIDKFTSRPFSVKYEKTTVGNDTIKRKKLFQDNTVTLGTFGEHKSLRPYSSKYQDANTFRNHELLGKHTNSQCLFELCLRVNGDIERTKIKRKKKEEMEKEKEERIKKNHIEYQKLKIKTN